MEPEWKDSKNPGMLKAYLALAALAAIVLGLILPVPHKSHTPPKDSQFATFEVGSG